MYTIFPYTPVFRTAVVAQHLVRQRDELVLDGGERVGIVGAARLVEQRLQFGERGPGVRHGDVRRRRQAALVQQVGERSEEHTSELQSLLRKSDAVFCLNNNKKHTTKRHKE